MWYTEYVEEEGDGINFNINRMFWSSRPLVPCISSSCMFSISSMETEQNCFWGFLSLSLLTTLGHLYGYAIRSWWKEQTNTFKRFHSRKAFDPNRNYISSSFSALQYPRKWLLPIFSDFWTCLKLLQGISQLFTFFFVANVLFSSFLFFSFRPSSSNYFFINNLQQDHIPWFASFLSSPESNEGVEERMCYSIVFLVIGTSQLPAGGSTDERNGKWTGFRDREELLPKKIEGKLGERSSQIQRHVKWSFYYARSRNHTHIRARRYTLAPWYTLTTFYEFVCS